MADIAVVTHNGKMPSEGGCRLGYCVGNLFIPTSPGGDALALQIKRQEEERQRAALQKAQEAERAAATERMFGKPIIVYADLRRALSYSGACRHCGCGPNDTQRLKTDQGWQNVVVCYNCGAEMRPYSAW